MDKKEVDYRDCLKETVHLLSSPGLLLACAGKDGTPNAMTIGWGTIGTIWGMPIFCVAVRPSRHTFSLIEETGDFTVNVPTAEMGDICAYCGSKSGRDVDKFIEMDITAMHVPEIKSPIIRECPINFVCSVVHANDVIPANLDAEIKGRAYKKGDFHRIYFGKILKTLRDK